MVNYYDNKFKPRDNNITHTGAKSSVIKDHQTHKAMEAYKVAVDEFPDKLKVRNAIIKQYGNPARMSEPDIEKGTYRGQIVVVTDQYVGQRLGANTFVIHKRECITGECPNGKFVNIQYNNQKGHSIDTTKRKEQKKEQGIER